MALKTNYEEYSSNPETNDAQLKKEIKKLGITGEVMKKMKKNLKEQGSWNNHLEIGRLLLEAEMAMNDTDCCKAETKYHKVIQLDPEIPHAYAGLANIYFFNSSRKRQEEAAKFSILAMEKIAFALFSGKSEENENRQDFMSTVLSSKSLNDLFLITMLDIINGIRYQRHALFEQCDEGESLATSVFKAEWVLEDQKLIRMVKYYLDRVTDENTSTDLDNIRLYNAMITYGTCLHGMISRGVPVLEPTSTMDRTKAEFIEAVTWYKKANLLGKSLKKVKGLFIHPDDIQESLIMSAKMMMMVFNQCKPSSSEMSPFQDGQWVIAHGLTSDIGKKLNEKIAQVKSKHLQQGRIPVIFQEGNKPKMIKPNNLRPAKMSSKNEALLLCLSTSDQWTIMKDKTNVL